MAPAGIQSPVTRSPDPARVPLPITLPAPSPVRTISATVSLTVLLAGCATVPTIRENTRAIVRSTEGINTNSEAVGETSSIMAGLEPSMTRLAELQAPMEALHEPMIQVAALGPELRNVAELEGPLTEVSARVTDLNQSMGTLLELRADRKSVV